MGLPAPLNTHSFYCFWWCQSSFEYDGRWRCPTSLTYLTSRGIVDWKCKTFLHRLICGREYNLSNIVIMSRLYSLRILHSTKHYTMMNIYFKYSHFLCETHALKALWSTGMQKNISIRRQKRRRSSTSQTHYTVPYVKRQGIIFVRELYAWWSRWNYVETNTKNGKPREKSHECGKNV